MTKVTQIFFLDTPAQCREFIEGIRTPEGGTVDSIGTESGKQIYFKDMADGEYVHYANAVADMLGIKRRVKRGNQKKR